MIENAKYLDFYSAREQAKGELRKEFDKWVDMHVHNNGYAQWVEVFNPEMDEEYAFAKINKFLLDNGAKIDDKVLFHFFW